jgi:hypothetical protein
MTQHGQVVDFQARPDALRKDPDGIQIERLREPPLEMDGRPLGE